MTKYILHGGATSVPSLDNKNLMKNFQKKIQLPKKDTAIQKKEFSFKEKKTLVAVWTNVVTGTNKMPDNIENWDNKKLKIWLYESLMAEIGQVISEWQMQVDEKLIPRDANHEQEEKYLKHVLAIIQAKMKQLPKDENKSQMWNSWPTTMRKSDQFNCVGAVLVGMHFLNKSNIKHYKGHLANHSINLCQLSNGTWWYADFLSNRLAKIKPRHNQITDIPCLEIDDPEVEYKIIGCTNAKDVIASVMGNLAFLQSLAKKGGKAQPRIPNNEKEAARKFYKKHQKQLDKIDLKNIGARLFPDLYKFYKSSALKMKKQRVQIIHDN